MKRYLFLVLCAVIFLCSSYLYCQAISQSDTVFHKGDKALTFSFDGLKLSGGLGGTFWFANDWAIRLIVSGSYNVDEDLTSNQAYHGLKAGITCYFEKHYYVIRNLSPYTGIGLGFNYSSDKGYYSIGFDEAFGLTSPVLIGAEYWVTQNISVSGEQQISFAFALTKSTRSFSVSGTTSTLLLSVYL